MEQTKQFTRLILAILPEVVVLLTLIGVLTTTNSTAVLLGYFVGLFWFVVILSISLERQAWHTMDKKEAKVYAKKVWVSLFVVALVFGQAAFFDANVAAAAKEIPPEVISSIIMFSIYAFFRAVIEVSQIKRVEGSYLLYEQKKVFHESGFKLAVGFAGVFLMAMLPVVGYDDTFASVTPTHQLISYSVVFILFIFQDIWFWWIERGHMNIEQKLKNVDRFTKWVLIAWFSIVFGGAFILAALGVE